MSLSVSPGDVGDRIVSRAKASGAEEAAAFFDSIEFVEPTPK